MWRILPTRYIYTYRVQADVTDGAGETQQTNLSLPVKTSVVLAIEVITDGERKPKNRPSLLLIYPGEPVDTRGDLSGV